MHPWHGVAVLWTLLHLGNCSMVQLKDNGYEDIVIAIHPAVPEDYTIIENIKSMVVEASSYLFNATHKGVFFKSVKIVIPLTWHQNPNYTRPRTESFNEADVIVADSFLKYGDDPYTLQYRGCGEKAKYIHFTPNFILNDKLLSVFGTRGRVFVHEWAHLRWGVFDEYNNETPFYVSRNFQVEATRCGADITGSAIFHECQDNYCSFRTCTSDPQTAPYNKGCMFLPDKHQSATASIMYMQALASVIAFCNASTHNAEAPTLQNRMCNSQSTWEVIMRSPDFNNSRPTLGRDSPPAPAFSLLQTRNRVVCLVLDVSGSMDRFDRIFRQRQAAELFLLQIVESGSFVGIVTFSHKASIDAELRQVVSDTEREDLVKLLPVKPNGGTAICEGIRAGFKATESQIQSTYGSEIILLTDGEDPLIPECFQEVENSGAIIHTIALGPDAAIQLETLAHMTGGLMFSAKDNLTSNGLIDAFSGLSSGNGNSSQHSVQLESISFTLHGIDCRKAPVSMDSTVGKSTFFVVTWQNNTPLIKVYDPHGKEYPQSNFSIDTTFKTARLKIPGIAKPGDWIYSLCNTESPLEIISLTVTSHVVNESIPPLTAKIHMSRDINTFPSPMVVYADVSQGFSPVIGANVIAIIEPHLGEPVILPLDDNGAGADIAKNDGIYSKYFTSFSGNGRYSIKVRVQGKEKSARLGVRIRRSHALYMPGHVENGNIQMNPPRPSVSDEDLQTNLEPFSRTASGRSFTVSAVPPGSLPDMFPPCTIFDLEAQVTNSKIELSWTAPGDDLDQGRATRYEVRMSGNPVDLKNTFENTTLIPSRSMKPQIAGSRETLIFSPEEEDLKLGHVTYFAVRAEDKVGNWSEISNIAQAALFVTTTATPTSPFISPEPPTFVPPSSTSMTCNPPSSYPSTSVPSLSDIPMPGSIHVPTVVITTCLIIVIVCLAISISLCIISCTAVTTSPQLLYLEHSLFVPL
ncbi:calcium-activated chloride channel regulator 1-like [Ambystoma mexicanum]|uniref:calcium-activated chloride channel regulator 1-like n=1 Tax=Ambystoma mexicanum TaxID=8296 RepID=UPI0037E74953